MIQGTVKWFDQIKQYGFVIPDLGDEDILMHGSVLFDYGYTSVIQGARVACDVRRSERGMQVSRIHRIEHPEQTDLAPESPDAPLGAAAVFVPARVQWYDNRRGLGVANAFGDPDDILVNAETLLRCGVGGLIPGEAIALCVDTGSNRKIALAACHWAQVRTTTPVS